MPFNTIIFNIPSISWLECKYVDDLLISGSVRNLFGIIVKIRKRLFTAFHYSSPVCCNKKLPSPMFSAACIHFQFLFAYWQLNSVYSAGNFIGFFNVIL